MWLTCARPTMRPQTRPCVPHLIPCWVQGLALLAPRPREQARLPPPAPLQIRANEVATRGLLSLRAQRFALACRLLVARRTAWSAAPALAFGGRGLATLGLLATVATVAILVADFGHVSASAASRARAPGGRSHGLPVRRALRRQRAPLTLAGCAKRALGACSSEFWTEAATRSTARRCAERPRRGFLT